MRKIIILIFLSTSLYSFGQINYSKYGVDQTKHIPVGLNIGDQAPSFSANDQYGNTVVLDSLLKKGSVVVIFYRGYWCPVCSRYLSNLQDSLAYIESRKATVVAITPEKPEGIQKTIAKTKSEFVILSDSLDKISIDYDVLFNVTNGYSTKIKLGLFTDISKNNGSQEAKLPVPATFIISPNRKIIYKQFDIDYKNRAHVIDMIKALENIGR